MLFRSVIKQLDHLNKEKADPEYRSSNIDEFNQFKSSSSSEKSRFNSIRPDIVNPWKKALDTSDDDNSSSAMMDKRPFSSLYASLGKLQKQKPLVFPSSYEPEDEEDEDESLADSSDSEETPSLFAAQEPEEDEGDDEDEEDTLTEPKRRFSGLRKIMS